MSRPAKPGPNGEPPAHRIQYPLSHIEWRKVQKAMRANGVRTMNSLVGMLLHREYERLGLTDALVLDEEKRAEAKPRGKKRRRA